MESQTPQVTETPNPADLSSESPGTLATTPSKTATGRQVQEALAPALDFLNKLPEDIGNFIAAYQKPLLYIFLFIVALVAVRVVLAILGAIDGIPLLSPLLELVGLGYTGWFVYRYLLKEDSRQELGQEFQSLKSQVLGGDSSKV